MPLLQIRTLKIIIILKLYGLTPEEIKIVDKILMIDIWDT